MEKNRLKIAAIALFGGLLALCALTAAPMVQTTQASSANLIGTFTGAPAESTCAITGCHGGAFMPNSDLLTIEASANMSVDHPDDRSYTIKVTLMPEDAARARWGFQMTAIQNDGQGVGLFMPNDATTAVPRQSGPTGYRPYIEHNIERDEAGNVTADGTFAGHTSEGAQWIFQWLPPDNFSGSVTFYAAGCAANNNNRSNGDRVYTRSLPISTGAALPPIITEVKLKGSKLLVTGMNFDSQALIYIDDKKVKKTNPLNDTMLIGKKLDDLVPSGTTVMIYVQNGNGQKSDPLFPFSVP